MGDRILIVDDSPINVAILEEILEKDFELSSAGSGEEALRVLRGFRPDLVLLDIMMPGMDGYEVCRRIRADGRCRHAKVIMVSAKGMVAERLEGYESGADDYVTKPFDEEELLSKVRVFLRLKSIEEVDRLKSDVFAVLSQEVVTPLRNIFEPALELRRDGPMPADERIRCGKLVHEGALRLQDFLRKVAALGSMKSGIWKFRYRCDNLGAVTRNALEKGGVENVTVRVSGGSPGDLVVLIDSPAIEEVLSCLVDTATRLTGSGGKIDLEVFAERQDACVRLSCEGKGVDPAAVAQAFEEFGGVGIEDLSDGQGLALALVRQVALDHHGRIDVDGRCGSVEFTLRLPRKRRQSAGGEATVSPDPVPPMGRTLYQGQIPANPALKRALARKIFTEAEGAGLVTELDRHEVTAAVEEAVDNAIVHGSREDPARLVYVRLFQDDEHCGVVVEDQGSGLKKSLIHASKRVRTDEVMRGVTMMTQVMDGVRFFRNGSAVVLSRHLDNL